MNRKEQIRLMVLNQVISGRLTAIQAAAKLGVSLRQVRRLIKAYRLEGAGGLAHGNRGRVPPRSFPAGVKARVLALAAQECYARCNDQHLSEILAERESLLVSRPTLRRWLRAAGRPSPRKRRPPRHRKRRDRAPFEGMLLQIDASYHPWFEDRAPRATLVGSIDDSTGKIPSAHFRPQEDTQGYFRLLDDILSTKGIPGSLYHDGRTTFVHNTRGRLTIADELEGRDNQTQFARAADYLGITLIRAHSPQAKGRIERLWETLQDRLVVELRLANISTIEAANAFLPRFLADFNHRFGLQPQQPDSAYLPLPPKLDVQAVCCHHFQRTVSADNTVSVKTLRLQLPPGPRGRSFNGLRVTVQRRLDGSWAIYHGDLCLAHPAELFLPNPKVPYNTVSTEKPEPRSKVLPPKLGHPWKRFFKSPQTSPNPQVSAR